MPIIDQVTLYRNDVAPSADGSVSNLGLVGNRLNEVKAEVSTPDMHVLSDRGEVFVCTNPTPGTAIVMIATTSTFAQSDTQPTMVIKNNAPLGGPRIYLDYIRLICGLKSAAGTTWQFACVIDFNPSVYTSGGSVTPGTIASGAGLLNGPVCVNQDSAAQSVAFVAFGAVTAVARSTQARLVAAGYLRPVVAAGTCMLAGDEYVLRFGAVEQAIANSGLQLAAGTPTLCIKNVIDVPAVILGPQQSMKLITFGTSNTTAVSYEFEASWRERAL